MSASQFIDSPTLLDLNNGLEALRRRARMAASAGRFDITEAYTGRLEAIQGCLRHGEGMAAASLLQTPVRLPDKVLA